MALDLQSAVDQFLHSPSSVTRTADAVEEWLQVTIRTAAFAGTAAEAPEATVAASAVASTIGTLPLIGLMLAAIVITLFVLFIVETLATLLRRVPWVGDAIANAWLTAFSFLTGIKQSSLRKIYQYERHLWHNLTVSIGYFATRHAAQIAPTITNVTSPLAAQVNKVLAHLQGEINNLQAEITALGSYVHHIPGTTLPSDIATLPDQIHFIETQVRTLYQNQVHQYHDMQNLTNAVNGIKHELTQLTNAVIGVRTVETGWQDIVTQIQQLEQADRDINARQSAAISTLTSTLAQLAPLTILLQPGMPGIKNLRKLEDNPCQCKTFGNIPGEILEAFGIYEFLTNG